MLVNQQNREYGKNGENSPKIEIKKPPNGGLYGRVTVKVLPAPTVLSTETVLPVSWQAVFTSASPSPLPTAQCEESP